MDYNQNENSSSSMNSNPITNQSLEQRIGNQKYWVHITLFVVCFYTTTISGVYWSGLISGSEYDWNNFRYGLVYSISFLMMLTFHEFGHFFASVYHRVQCSLPYYLPVPPIPFMLNIGTLGAVIRIKERIPTSKSLFDIGVAGPLSGFVVSFLLLLIGFATLPDISHIYTIHPEYKELGFIPELSGSLVTGKNLLYLLFENIFRSENAPPMTEMYHYPLLFAGWLGCVVTALNLIPVGQLDGGHVIYAMFGKKKQILIAKIALGIIVIMGLPSLIQTLAEVVFLIFQMDGIEIVPEVFTKYSWLTWIIWAIILVRFVKIEHPPVLQKSKLNIERKIVGWLSIIVFLLCFTPVPFYLN